MLNDENAENARISPIFRRFGGFFDDSGTSGFLPLAQKPENRLRVAQESFERRRETVFARGTRRASVGV
jgi:hypothetical protein